MQCRVATFADIPTLRRLAEPLRVGVSEELSMQLLVQPISRCQTLVFEENGNIVSYLSVALMSKEVARKFVEDDEVDFNVTGPDVWIVEYSGDGIHQANDIFTDFLRKSGWREYRYFREKDQRVHVVRF